MQIVIDIPDTQYNNIMEVKSMNLGRIPYKGIIMNAIRGIQNGIPLDKIRAEIEQGYCKVEDDYDRGRNMGLYIAMQIIDHYKAEIEEA